MKFDDNSTQTYDYYATGGNIGSVSYFEKVKFTDESGKTKETYYDIGGNIAAEKLGTNSPLIYHYNSINQLTSVVSPAGLTTSYTYDGFGNIASKTNPDEGTYKYKYDTNSNLRFLFHTTASPLELTFNTYDPLNRLVSTGVKSTTATEFNNLNPDILNSFESDTSKLVVAYMYDKYTASGVFPVTSYGSALTNLKGRLAATAFRDKSGFQWGYKLYDYDYNGRIIHSVIKPPIASWWIVIANFYDNQDNLTEQVVNNASGSNKFAYWYSYDLQGRLYQVHTNTTDNYSTSTLDATYTYKTDDQIDQLRYPGPFIQYSYDQNRGWVTNIEEVALDQFRELLTYYNNGNIHYQTITNSVWSDLATTFSYDGLNRLTNASVSGHSNYNESFSYNNDGNILTSLRGGSYYYQSGTDKLTSIESPSFEKYYMYSYDNKGNVTSKREASAGNIFSISGYNRNNLPLTISTPNGTFNYYYDDQGNRIIKKSSTSTEFYVRDHTGKELAIYELSGSYTLKMVNIYGIGLIGRGDIY